MPDSSAEPIGERQTRLETLFKSFEKDLAASNEALGDIREELKTLSKSVETSATRWAARDAIYAFLSRIGVAASSALGIAAAAGWLTGWFHGGGK